ncbi:MAG: hypothetical protein V4662_10985 [Verrucomicrobiota bacterium]
MKINTFVITLLFGLAAISARAEQLAINGVDFDGYGGVYQIVDFNNENYWWMCIEPTSGQSGTFIADALSFQDGWVRQTEERQTFFMNDPNANPDLQVRVMEYVLDTYLPWHLTGAGRFLEQSSDSGDYGNDDEFYNAFFTVQHFIAEAYGKGNLVDFTDLSEFRHDVLPEIGWDGGSAASNPDALAARLALFDSILNDVENKAGIAGFFETYNVQGTYLVANSYFSENDIDNNYQDALIIVAPVPEPSGALLIACAGMVVMFRRFRRLA